MPPIKKAKAVEPAKEESKSILRYLLSLNTNRVSLDFGPNENCRLIKIGNTPRIKEGETVKKNTFLTFAKYNSKNEIIGQNEFSFFNLDPEGKYAFENFITQLSQLTTLANLLNPEVTFDPTEDFESEEEIVKLLSTPKGCKELQNKMFDTFSEVVSDFVGEQCPLMAVKVVTDKTGKYMQLPKEAQFCTLMTEDHSFLKATAYEIKLKNAALAPATAVADEKGAAPSEVKKSALANL
jgi:hypothetical protein